MRQELIELSVQWNDIGLDGARPYDPTTEELERHGEQYADFEIALNLKLGLMRSLRTDSDGWVASDGILSSRPTTRCLGSGCGRLESMGEWMRGRRESCGLLTKYELPLMKYMYETHCIA